MQPRPLGLADLLPLTLPANPNHLRNLPDSLPPDLIVFLTNKVNIYMALRETLTNYDAQCERLFMGRGQPGENRRNQFIQQLVSFKDAADELLLQRFAEMCSHFIKESEEEEKSFGHSRLLYGITDQLIRLCNAYYPSGNLHILMDAISQKFTQERNNIRNATVMHPAARAAAIKSSEIDEKAAKLRLIQETVQTFLHRNDEKPENTHNTTRLLRPHGPL